MSKKIFCGVCVLCAFLPFAGFSRDTKSATPRLIEVEEDVWIRTNQEKERLRDEALRMSSELRIAEEEIERLQQELVTVKSEMAGRRGETTYAVKDGDSLWSISRKFYDDPYKWLWVFKANIGQIDDPDHIYPEQILEIPRY